MTERRQGRHRLGSGTDEWSTPAPLFDMLDREFAFDLDPCSDESNFKCEQFFTRADDGLRQDWGRSIVFMNPPYSECFAWVEKAFFASLGGATVVCLLPARTDSGWWHAFTADAEVRFLRGRLRFEGGKSSAPFPSVIVIFKAQNEDKSSSKASALRIVRGGKTAAAQPDRDHRLCDAAWPFPTSRSTRVVGTSSWTRSGIREHRAGQEQDRDCMG